jgi:DNA polymerase elongation subunit (family B)
MALRHGIEMSDEDAEKFDALIQEAEYCDRLQYVFKIKLNSLYGALSNLYFRFYDLRMGESTTATGRAVLRHQCRKVSEILDGNYDVDFPLGIDEADCIDKGFDPRYALHGKMFNSAYQSDSVVYGDTDSCYFKTHQDDLEMAIAVADEVAAQVNASYPEFMREAFLCQPGFDNLIKCAREIVSDAGIFVQKKRYTLHIADKEGKRTDKMKVMGLDTKKTILPKKICDDINNFVEMFLKGMSWEELSEKIVEYKSDLVKSGKILQYGLPTGVGGVEKYTAAYLKEGMKARLSGSAAPAIHYNLCLERYNDRISPPITSGTKIRKYYLKKPIEKFKTIALPTDLVDIPEWFHELEIDNLAMVKRLVDNPINNIVKAIGKKPPTRQTLLDDKLVEY